LQLVRFLPKTGEPVLLAVILLLVLGYLTLGALYLRDLLTPPHPLTLPFWFSFPAMVFCFALAIGLWFLHPIARWMAMATLAVVIVAAPFAIINPFNAMEIEATTGEAPSKFALMLWAFSLTVPAALALYVLHRHKAQFNR